MESEKLEKRGKSRSKDELKRRISPGEEGGVTT